MKWTWPTIAGFGYLVLGLGCMYAAFRTYGSAREALWAGGPIVFSAGIVLRWKFCSNAERSVLAAFLGVQCFLSLLTDWEGLRWVAAAGDLSAVRERIVHFEEGGTADFLLQLLRFIVTALNAAVIVWMVSIVRTVGKSKRQSMRRGREPDQRTDRDGTGDV